ncbi:FAD-dependent monooxygenase [Roseomonas sp. PWR1]|uniref:FAD-dependent monooxygenase n=1 Tax=Roseomonas nitratireducens TaxID=2820810 RepID=A0ABS4AT15_9PROT|nr:FAD-dependent monooxygenase [Neoroseomonas nitratireducens]MBP0464490.1 FAD-dependent monooxygenase [Neoroseomonas nitratireducens]
MTDNRVLIAGAGPAGLVAAAALAEEGIPVTIVEQARDLPDDLRASTFHPPTLDMLERFGVVEAMIAQGLVCPTWQFRDRHQGVIATFDLGMLKDDTKHPYRLQCEQWRLTRMLRDRLGSNPDVTFLYDAKAVDVAQDADGVTLTVERPDGTRERLRGRYLVGADGASSAVRKALGIGFDGITIPEIFLTLSTTFPFHEAIADLSNIAYISDPEEWFVLLRTASLWRVLFPTDPGESEARMMDPARIEERLQAVVPNPSGYELRHRTAYRVHERVADTYAKGRCFIAGDAAHINNPLGGMGMNGGVHDAFNLAGKLAEVWRGGDPALMERYSRQRRKVALETVQATTMRNRQILNQRDPEVRRAYHDELRATAADPGKHRAFLLRTSMIQSLRDLEQVA